MKHFRLILSIFVIILVLLLGCYSINSAAAPEPGRTEVVFWHSMGGVAGQTLQNIINDFNQSQDKIYVKPVYQGSYEESLAKFRTIGGTKDVPAIVQTYEVGTKFMIDSGYITPVQFFIDKNHYDTSALEKNILSFYTINGKLYSMPFNSSTPVLMYNADAFKKAGINPNKPPMTFSEVEADAKKLTQTDKGMDGFSFLNYPWYFEEMLTTQRGYNYDHANGRTGSITRSLVNSPKGVRIFSWLQKMRKEHLLAYFGTNGGNEQTAFLTGKLGMYLSSSASAAQIIQNAPFKVGIGFLPHADGVKPQGVAIGGASLWLPKGPSAKTQQAAFTFMKYLESPAVQAKWHVGSGYFPINTKAYDEPLLKKTYKKIPQLKVSADQLHSTVTSYYTRGFLTTITPQARMELQQAIDSVMNGQAPKKTLDTAANSITDIITQTNRANQK
ncbi:ABC transporter substrate-binding protein [Sporolactobacillus shoreicorticis]|uniref:ABC transporter substrate-binding protein n=1 Tax=Sporolactobacillus shoreicorticis TaxID=1923877 RepID=A0ABW5S5F9_9BACL|nr:ABC transporter substrate-binding protein [Sporolactobacillus shoreicorticis]MCO7126191.1 ABC transporter substrate-binding protein [Sporolactobacillus shoreicorticis]